MLVECEAAADSLLLNQSGLLEINDTRAPPGCFYVKEATNWICMYRFNIHVF